MIQNMAYSNIFERINYFVLYQKYVIVVFAPNDKEKIITKELGSPICLIKEEDIINKNKKISFFQFQVIIIKVIYFFVKNVI